MFAVRCLMARPPFLLLINIPTSLVCLVASPLLFSQAATLLQSPWADMTRYPVDPCSLLPK